jgi:hypothetical protein
MSTLSPDAAARGTRVAAAGTPLDEYEHLGEDLRHYGILRLYRLTLLLGTAGAMVTALASENLRAHPMLFGAVKWTGLAVTIAFAIMDYRSGNQWIRLQARANELAAVLGFRSRDLSHPWNPLSTTGALRILHLLIVLAWMILLASSTLGGR